MKTEEIENLAVTESRSCLIKDSFYTELEFLMCGVGYDEFPPEENGITIISDGKGNATLYATDHATIRYSPVIKLPELGKGRLNYQRRSPGSAGEAANV